MTAEIPIAIISACSAIFGGLTTGLVQYWLAKASASREEKRQRRVEFRECLVRFIEETDPDIHPVPSIPEITKNTIRLQLYLNLEDADQRKLNGQLNALASSVSGYSDSQDKKLILQTHSKLIEAANRIFRKYKG